MADLSVTEKSSSEIPSGVYVGEYQGNSETLSKFPNPVTKAMDQKYYTHFFGFPVNPEFGDARLTYSTPMKLDKEGKLWNMLLALGMPQLQIGQTANPDNFVGKKALVTVVRALANDQKTYSNITAVSVISPQMAQQMGLNQPQTSFGPPAQQPPAAPGFAAPPAAPQLPPLPAGTKYGPGNIIITVDEKYQLVNNQWVAYNPVTSSPKPPTVLPTRAGVTVQQKSTQDDTLVERVTTAKESGGFQTLKSAMPVTGEEGTILVGSPSRVIAEMGNKPVTISPANRNKFRRLKGMKDTFITAFGNAGIAQPSDLLRFQPDQLLAMLGLAAVTPNQDMVSSWAEMVAQMHNVSPDQG